jgi:hypothetical protein
MEFVDELLRLKLTTPGSWRWPCTTRVDLAE